ncbi:MAG: ROK family protein [Mariprofundaceae bacterium]|nr:ROK family protein [Mariprofundaceae bacterium]
MLSLVADVGGTNIRVAIVEDGNIIAEQRVEARLSQHQAKNNRQAESILIDTLSSAFNPLLEQFKPHHIGIGFPGFFAGDTGVLLSSPNIPKIHDFNISEAIESHTSLPTYVHNDALCAALGEFHFGVGKQQQSRDLLHVTLGTGVGAGLILNGLPYAGQHGMAMEFGHLYCPAMQGDEVMLCGCGNEGCLETYASATAIVKRYFACTQQEITAKEVAARAQAGDVDAQRIIEHAGAYLGASLAEFSKLLDIQHISMSGGLSGAWSQLYPSMQKSLNAQLIPPLRQKISIQASQLGDNAGLLGASLLSSY